MWRWLAIAAGEVGAPNVSATGSVDKILDTVYFWAGAVAVIVIVIAGFKFVTSGGDEKAVVSARNMILGAVIGLIVIICAFVITSFVMNGVK